jgi:hypothetical protein
MQQLILNIEESRYQVLLKFLSTLDYVRIVKPEKSTTPVPSNNQGEGSAGNQLSLLKKLLKQQTKPLFQQITDPVAWQNQQRDEWS